LPNPSFLVSYEALDESGNWGYWARCNFAAPRFTVLFGF